MRLYRKTIATVLLALVLLVAGAPAMAPPTGVPNARANLFDTCEYADLWSQLSCILVELVMEGFDYTWR